MTKARQFVMTLLLSPVLAAGCSGRPKEVLKGAVVGANRPVDKERTFLNPILPGFYPDPSICGVGDDYYLVLSSFEYFPGVPIFHSKDLVNWRQLGHVLTRESQLPLEKMRASGGIYAPTIRYHDGTFYVVTTNVDGGGNFYVTAKDPEGPWSEPVWLDEEGMDPSLFFDDDGTVYYTRHEGEGDGHIAQRVLDLEKGELRGPLRKIWGGTGGIWAEGPHLYKINSRYYLMISEGGTSYDHMVTIARSGSPWGPFEANPRNPIFTHRHLPEHPVQALGHADLVETPDGWWLVALGIRPQPPGKRFHHMGRETFLAPVAFNSAGWPVVNHDGTVQLEMTAPNLPEHPWPKASARESFDDKVMPHHFNYLRNPRESDYDLEARPGYLRLWGTAVTMRDQDSPTFVGRRQTHFSSVAKTQLEFEPAGENEEAGVVVRANDKHHFQAGITVRGGKRQALFRKVVKGKVAKAVAYTDVPPGPLVLSIEASPLKYEFFIQYPGGEDPAVKLGEGNTKDLSVEAIGFEDGMCFTGAYFGMYATGNGERSKIPADFDWFAYRARDE
jgi:alpha-N-arabinofuranosidase